MIRVYNILILVVTVVLTKLQYYIFGTYKQKLLYRNINNIEYTYSEGIEFEHSVTE